MLLAVPTLLPTARGVSSPANLTVQLTPAQIPVSISLNMVQNLTSLQSDLGIPQFQGILEGSNSTALTASLQTALEGKNAHIQVSNVRFFENSSAWSQTLGIQTLNLTLSFVVSGVQQNRLGASIINLQWKSFVVPDKVAMGTFEANNLGSYLAKGAEELSILPPSETVDGATIIRQARVDSIVTHPNAFPRAVANRVALNFSMLSLPVSKWTPANDFYANKMTWSLTSLPRLGIDYRIISTEAGSETTVDYVLAYSLQAKISAPAFSSAQSDTIFAEFDSTPEFVMSLTILGPIIIVLVVTIFEMRISKQSYKRKRR